jgi:sugar O-acyltransferase (sialic acid O-acetyltransferase NeuD family)
MGPLLLLGAGGHARVVAETALATGRFSSIAFLDDDCSGPVQLPDQFGWPLIGPFAEALDPKIRHQYPAALVAIGNATVRLQWLWRIASFGYEIPVVIHPTAWLSPTVQIGVGSVVFAQVAIQAQAVIGSGAILNTGCTVDHDARLADGVHICPGAHLAGEVQVGERSWIGIGASVMQQIRIGADVTVGAGAAVVRDLPDGVTAVGVPARLLPTS